MRFYALLGLPLIAWLWISNVTWSSDIRKHKEKIHKLEDQVAKLKLDNDRFSTGSEPMLCVSSLRDLLTYYAGLEIPGVCGHDGLWVEGAARTIGVSYLVVKTAIDNDNAAFFTLDQRHKLVDWAVGHSCHQNYP